MKKFLALLALLLIGGCSFAEEVIVIRGVNMNNFWNKKGITEEKVLKVGQKIMLDNKIDNLKGTNTATFVLSGINSMKPGKVLGSILFTVMSSFMLFI